MNTSANIRQAFLDFFSERGHQVVPSASLIPGEDPTLLFTNAGMVPFKDVFLGREKRSYLRATSAQRCVRAGGKHNDLENVGYTARHHTFFEMLGNFSFGDYFKREAIAYSWEFLTQILHIDPQRLWITVYEDDKEAEAIWLHEIGVDPARFSRIGAEDNFWSMGDTGPCGPCSEIFFDHGANVPGGPPGTAEQDGDRYVEIWNLVFMQYDRDAQRQLNPLPKPSVDTGMGLERLVAVLQGVHSNYETDLFRPLLQATAALAQLDDLQHHSLQVIADHIRSCAFLVVDGILPSNEGRGYVLRRIIRRAVRHGRKIGLKDTFFHRLVAPLCKVMGPAYPELAQAEKRTAKVLQREEERFAETLDQGMKILEQTLAGLSTKEIPGDIVFKLYDTYGFPVDLSNDIARERGLTLDHAGFEQAMQAQRKRGQEAHQFAANYSAEAPLINGITAFQGYDTLEQEVKIQALIQKGQLVQRLEEGEPGQVVLQHTPFYAESGGQVGDHGLLSGLESCFQVEDTRKQGAGIFMHIGTMTKGTLCTGQLIQAQVDAKARQATVLNHSATHLMHAALRKILGQHVTQKGSLVSPQRLRFDFSHDRPVTSKQLTAIASLVNQQIRNNDPAETRLMALEQAKESGAMALFGEKYSEQVRVVRLGEFSTELCGGTHVRHAGDIGLFKIISEGGVASGIRRIEAVTGAKAITAIEENDQRLNALGKLLKASKEDIPQKVQHLLEQNRQMEKELQRLQAKLASAAGKDLASQAVDVAGTKVLALKIAGAEPAAMLQTVDQLKEQLGDAAILLASISGNKVKLVAGVTKQRAKQIKAGDLLNSVALQLDGRGGGRPEMAQGVGNRPEHLDAALDSVESWVREQLA